MANLIFGLIELVIGVFCSVQQMNTTHDSVFSALQGGTLVTSHLSAMELLQVLQMDTDKYNRIGWMVAWVTQVIFWGTIMPASPVHSVKLYRFVVGTFLALEVITDVWYSVATGTTLGGVFMFVFSLGPSGIFSALCYVAAMSAGSIFILIDGIHRLEKSLGPVFAAQHAKPAPAQASK